MGATSGLGRGVAIHLLQQGWTVGAVGRDITKLHEFSSEWGSQVIIRQIDITHNDATEKLNKLIADMGGIDIYFHCSGILPSNERLDTDKEILTVQTNVEGFTRMISTAYRYFRDNKSTGKIAAISSIAGLRGVGQLASYCASKAFDSTYLEAIRQLAAIEKTAVTVIDIRPGWVRTPLLADDKKYLLEMSEQKAVKLITRALLHSRRSNTIGLRWRIITTIERLVPSSIWQKLNLNRMLMREK